MKCQTTAGLYDGGGSYLTPRGYSQHSRALATERQQYQLNQDDKRRQHEWSRLQTIWKESQQRRSRKKRDEEKKRLEEEKQRQEALLQRRRENQENYLRFRNALRDREKKNAKTNKNLSFRQGLRDGSWYMESFPELQESSLATNGDNKSDTKDTYERGHYMQAMRVMPGHLVEQPLPGAPSHPARLAPISSPPLLTPASVVSAPASLPPPPSRFAALSSLRGLSKPPELNSSRVLEGLNLESRPEGSDSFHEAEPRPPLKPLSAFQEDSRVQKQEPEDHLRELLDSATNPPPRWAQSPSPEHFATDTSLSSAPSLPSTFSTDVQPSPAPSSAGLQRVRVARAEISELQVRNGHGEAWEVHTSRRPKQQTRRVTFATGSETRKPPRPQSPVIRARPSNERVATAKSTDLFLYLETLSQRPDVTTEEMEIALEQYEEALLRERENRDLDVRPRKDLVVPPSHIPDIRSKRKQTAFMRAQQQREREARRVVSLQADRRERIRRNYDKHVRKPQPSVNIPSVRSSPVVPERAPNLRAPLITESVALSLEEQRLRDVICKLREENSSQRTRISQLHQEMELLSGPVVSKSNSACSPPALQSAAAKSRPQKLAPPRHLQRVGKHVPPVKPPIERVALEERQNAALVRPRPTGVASTALAREMLFS